jgi:aerobic carbon-monoxide dehydrogenase medium subunit
LPALGARVRLRSPVGHRDLAMEEFMTGALETALQANELVESVRVPLMRASARWGYAKACRKPGEFAHAIAAVMIDPETATGRVVIGAIEAPPIVLTDASPLFDGKITSNFKREFVAEVADALLIKAGIVNAADRHIHIAILRRAIDEAAA